MVEISICSVSPKCRCATGPINSGDFLNMMTDIKKQSMARGIPGLLCGAFAGMTASTIIQPLDLVRRRQQVRRVSFILSLEKSSILNTSNWISFFRKDMHNANRTANILN